MDGIPLDADAAAALFNLLNSGWTVTMRYLNPEIEGDDGASVLVHKGAESHAFVRTFHQQALVDAWETLRPSRRAP